MSFDEHKFLRLSMAGMKPEEIARKLGVSTEEAQAFAGRMELETGVSTLFSERLKRWSAEGLIRRNWSVRLNADDGSYRMKFQVGEEKYDLTEAQMEIFALGVEAVRRHKENE